MFGQSGKKNPGPLTPEKFDTILGPNTQVQGDIEVSESIRIDGCLNGNITGVDKAPVTVVVGTHGVVHGNVAALRVVVVGKVHGSIEAQEEIELHSGCVVEGDVSCGSVSIAHGAKVMGRLIASQDRLSGVISEPTLAAIGHKKKVELVA